MTSTGPARDPLASDEVDKDYYNPKVKPLPSDPTLRAYITHVHEQGYVIIPNAFSEVDALAAKAEIDRLHGDSPRVGRKPVEGFKTNRVYALLAKTRVFDKFCMLPQVHALNEHFLDENYLLYIMQTITINPGEKAQRLHYDDGLALQPRPRPPLSVATMIVLDDYTELNGATRIIPGSHKWGSDRVGEGSEAISVVCPRGSVVYFLGTTWHSGGANRTDKSRYAATIQYCQPFVRPLENLMVAVDPRRALSGEIPGKIVDMMGYKSAFPFIGYADGMNPRKASQRMVRWLQGPIDYDLPAFAKETGKKEVFQGKL